MHRRFLKLKVVAALFSAAFLFGAVDAGAYTYSGVTSTVDKVAEDENELIVTGGANITGNGNVNPQKVKRTIEKQLIGLDVADFDGEMYFDSDDDAAGRVWEVDENTMKKIREAYKNGKYKTSKNTDWDASWTNYSIYFPDLKGTEWEVASNLDYIICLWIKDDFSGAVCDLLENGQAGVPHTANVSIPTKIYSEVVTDETNLGDASIIVSNNSKLISKGSVQTSKAISVTGSSRLVSSGSITGGSLYSDGAIISTSLDQGESVFAYGDITVSGLLKSDTYVAGLVGGIRANQIQAGSYLVASNSVSAGGVIQAGGLNVGGVNASSLTTTGNSSIAGVHRITGQTKFNGSVAMNGQKISTLGKGTLSASSTDAVNGAQLYEVQQKVSSASSGGLSAGGDISISSANAISVNKAGKIASGNAGIVTGGTVYNVTNVIQTSVNSISSTVKKNATSITSLENTMADLKKSVAATNTEVGSTTKNLSSTLSSRLQADLGNLSDDGKSVIKNLIAETLRNMNTASVAATSENGISMVSNNSDSVLYSSAGEDTLSSVSITPTTDTAMVNTANENIVSVSENTVGAGIEVASSVTASDLDGVYTALDAKTNKVDFSSLKNSVDSNTVAIAANSKDITDNAFAIDVLKTDKAEADGANINTSKYSEKLGIGKVEKGNAGLVTGGTVAKALDTKADTAYVNAGLGLMSNHLESVKQTATHDMNRMGANAAALASLHPQGYNSEDKLDFAAGYGHYRDNNASAVGAFYRPNAATMVSLSGTVGNGDSMVSAGLSFKLGMNANVEKVMITKDTFDKQQATNQAMKGKLDNQTARLQAMEEALSAMIRN